jgi:NTE family protein
MAEGQALVLGGGGVAGIAWMTGVLAGLAEAGQDVTAADLLVGTSAGAAVAAQVGSGLPVDALFARQVEPALQAREISVELDMEKLAAEFAGLLAGPAATESAQDAQRRVGAYALAARTVPEADRRAAVSSRLPSPEWPSRRMLLVAVDAESGETRRGGRGCPRPLSSCACGRNSHRARQARRCGSWSVLIRGSAGTRLCPRRTSASASPASTGIASR